MANESDRSKVILIDPKAKTENFIRSKHNDFATSAELRSRKFDGWRHNSLEGVVELWIDGGIVRRVTDTEAALDPEALDKAFAEYFAQHM